MANAVSYTVSGTHPKTRHSHAESFSTPKEALAKQCIRLGGATWRCGQQAALALSDRIGRSVVYCDARGRDRYGRIISICSKDTEDLNRWMVANGWAVAYRKYSLDYVADEERAHLAKVDIWSGTFEMPWDWRSQKRQR